MPKYDRQEYDGRFKLTFVGIAIVHLLALGGLLFVSLSGPSRKEEKIVWMNPGSLAESAANGENASAASRESAPSPGEHSLTAPEESRPESTPQAPLPAPPPTDPKLPVPMQAPPQTPPPTPKSSPLAPLSPTPKPTPKNNPSPTPKAASKPSPKPSATPTPMPKPSITRPPHQLEASPKEKAKEKPEVEKSPKTETPLKSKAFTEKPNDKDAVKPSPSPGAHSEEVDKGSNDRAASGPAGTSHANTGGKRSGGTGSGVEDFALSAYVGVLTNRFQAAWNQPTGEISMGKTLEVTVKLKVEADGTVTEFTIMAGSGNAVVDESVREAGKRIRKLPPPPNNQAFSAPVRFELGN